MLNWFQEHVPHFLLPRKRIMMPYRAQIAVECCPNHSNTEGIYLHLPPPIRLVVTRALANEVPVAVQSVSPFPYRRDISGTPSSP